MTVQAYTKDKVALLSRSDEKWVSLSDYDALEGLVEVLRGQIDALQDKVMVQAFNIISNEKRNEIEVEGILKMKSERVKLFDSFSADELASLDGDGMLKTIVDFEYEYLAKLRDKDNAQKDPIS